MEFSQSFRGIKNVDMLLLLYKPGLIFNPFTKKYNEIIFADDTASGRPCKFIDELLKTNVIPYYSNTHSNATCGTMMKNLVNKTKDLIRQYMNISSDKSIIFSGNGCTGAVNHLVNKIDFTVYTKICIHTSQYEHHSNFLPWREKLLDHQVHYPDTEIQYNYIPQDEENNLDLMRYIEDMDNEINEEHTVLKKSGKKNKFQRIDIWTVTGCSNVTGKRYDLQFKMLWDYIQSKKRDGHKMYLFIDYACSAPYVPLNLATCDGAFFSGHKFLGGQSTPGVLIASSELLQLSHPYQPGGGCVDEANDQSVRYKNNPESMETCGTPNIMGIIRLGYCLTLKESLIQTIERNENKISEITMKRFKNLQDKYPDLRVIGLSERSIKDLPIYPVTIKGLHYNLITVLLNDLSGIQTRGGLSCCGTFGRICSERDGISGWCRISFNYLMTSDQIDLIFKTIEFILVNKKRLKKRYSYNLDSNMYYYDQSLNKNKHIIS